MDFLGTCGYSWPQAWDRKVPVGSSSWGTALWSAESGMEAEARLLLVIYGSCPSFPFFLSPASHPTLFFYSPALLPPSPHAPFLSLRQAKHNYS